nr:hypothetical protein [Pelagerythrobacter marinus]
MFGLFPIERLGDQLPRAFPCRHRHQHPVPDHREAVGREREPIPPEGRQHHHEDEQPVPGQKVEQRQVEQDWGEERVEHARFGHQPEREDQPEQRVQQARQHRAADEENEAQNAQRADRLHQVQRPARVHEESLHIALDPARALPDPVALRDIGFLERGRGGKPHFVSLLRQPDAQVGILRHIERVPGAQFAQHVHLEVVRRPAERDRHLEFFQPGQHEIEPQRIVEREQPREPVLVAIEIVQPALDAGDVLGRAIEGDDHFLQLVRLGLVLGIVDDEIFSARELQRVIARLGLGLRLRGRDEDDLEDVLQP